jgi:dihydropyrimidinase
MNTDYNAFEGLEVQGWPETVLLRGRTIVMDNHWLGKEGDGRFIHRNIGNFL